ncbi:MAG: VOC family protein [Ignavibacteriae bacterium]|nr:VOC family protein [Ignavibacteriota bacterium]
MIFEHFALNVNNPIEIAEWYSENLEMKIVRKIDEAPFTHFLADKTGRVVIEVYNNSKAKIINLKSKHSLEFHLAFMVKNADEVKNNLIHAGAVFEEDLILNDGSHLVMLRDPFGMPLQICERGVPMMNIEL